VAWAGPGEPRRATAWAGDASLLGDVDARTTLDGPTVELGIQPNTTNATQEERDELRAISPTVSRTR